MKKKLIVGVLSCSIGLGLGVSSAYAYTILHSGFTPIPAYITAYSGLSPESKTAIHNANLQWNSAGRGDLVYRTTYDHNNTTYPYQNSKNEVTKGNRGTDKYLMETATWKNSSNKAIEADIDINSTFAAKFSE